MEATILQIDDDQDILSVGKRMFKAAGYRFVSARTVESGLKQALIRRPSLILLDYTLGTQTGFDFLKILAADKVYQPVRQTPIIMFSGMTDLIDELETYYSLGLRAVLKKPFDQKAMVNVVENIIRTEAILNRSVPLPPTPVEDVTSDWLEEVKMSVETMTALSYDIYRESAALLSENRVMDIRAIYNSSRRLLKMINEKLGAA